MSSGNARPRFLFKVLPGDAPQPGDTLRPLQSPLLPAAFLCSPPGMGGRGEAGSAEVISSYSFDVEWAHCSPHPGRPQRPTALGTGRVVAHSHHCPIPAPAEAGSVFQAHVCRLDGVHDGMSGDDRVSGGAGRVLVPGRGGEAERRAGGMWASCVRLQRPDLSFSSCFSK